MAISHCPNHPLRPVYYRCADEACGFAGCNECVSRKRGVEPDAEVRLYCYGCGKRVNALAAATAVDAPEPERWGVWSWPLSRGVDAAFKAALALLLIAGGLAVTVLDGTREASRAPGPPRLGLWLWISGLLLSLLAIPTAIVLAAWLPRAVASGVDPAQSAALAGFDFRARLRDPRTRMAAPFLLAPGPLTALATLTPWWGRALLLPCAAALHLLLPAVLLQLALAPDVALARAPRALLALVRARRGDARRVTLAGLPAWLPDALVALCFPDSWGVFWLVTLPIRFYFRVVQLQLAGRRWRHPEG